MVSPMKSMSYVGLALSNLLLLPVVPPAFAQDDPAPPSTWDQYRKGTQSFNEQEKRLWKELYLPQKLCMKQAKDEAARANKQSKFSGTTLNGPGDAVRHCVWSCEMTRCLGEQKAKLWGDAHEANPSPDEEKQMDFYNNDQGRKTWATIWDRKTIPTDFSFNGKCAQACEAASATGTLKVLSKDTWR